MPMKMPMMEMYFHFRLEEYLLFKEWLPKTLIVYLFSLLAVFAISALYEALRVGRVVLFRLEEERQPQNCIAEDAQLSAAPEGCDCPHQFFYGTQNDSSSESLFSGWHVLQSLLHFLQFVLGFVLMLLAMTYNMPVFLVLLLGHTFGYFIAGPLYRNGLAEEGRVGGECCCS